MEAADGCWWWGKKQMARRGRGGCVCVPEEEEEAREYGGSAEDRQSSGDAPQQTQHHNTLLLPTLTTGSLPALCLSISRSTKYMKEQVTCLFGVGSLDEARRQERVCCCCVYDPLINVVLARSRDCGEMRDCIWSWPPLLRRIEIMLRRIEIMSRYECMYVYMYTRNTGLVE